MNIELAPEEYYIFCTYDEAVLYCFTLEIDGKTGWRLPIEDEYYNHNDIPANSWYLNDPAGNNRYTIVPVRDLT